MNTNFELLRPLIRFRNPAEYQEAYLAFSKMKQPAMPYRLAPLRVHFSPESPVILQRPDDDEGLAAALQQCPAANRLQNMPSDQGRRSQASRLRQLAHLMGACDWHQVDWARLDVADFQGLLTTLRSMKDPRTKASISVATYNTTRIALRKVMQWASMLGQMDENVWSGISKIDGQKEFKKVARAGRHVPKDERKRTLKRVAKGTSEARVARDLVILLLMFDMGLRRQEVVDLSVTSVGLKSKELMVTGKGKKTRAVPIVGTVDRALERWLTIRGSWPGPLICQIHRTGKVLRRGMTGERVYAITTEYSSEDLIRLTPHDCRRTFCSDMIDVNGGDLSVAKELMGHEHISTTEMYDRRPKTVNRAAMKALNEGRNDDDLFE